MASGDKQPDKSALGSKKKREATKTQVARHEKEMAELLGGHAQPASGATPGKKGDIVLGDGLLTLDRFLLESKETTAGSILIDGRVLTKISREAMEVSRTPGLVITIEKLPSSVPNTWVAVPIDVFAEMLEARKGK